MNEYERKVQKLWDEKMIDNETIGLDSFSWVEKKGETDERINKVKEEVT